MSNTAPPLLFDRSRQRHNRRRAAPHLARHGALFDAVNEQILERLGDIRRPFQRILDLGSRDFSLAQALLKHDPQRTLVHAALTPLTAPLPAGITALELDDEWLPFADATFDLIIANMNLHAVNDVPGTLIQMRRCLKPDGLLLAAFIGGDSLMDVRATLQEAEMATRGGASLHFSPMIDVRDAGMLLMRAGFALPVVDRAGFTLTYAGLHDLLRELRHMGEGNSLAARDKRFMGRTLFNNAAELYRNRFSDAEGRIPAHFEVIFLAGWAPSPIQQVPLKPGEAKNRLADALHSSQIKLAD